MSDEEITLIMEELIKMLSVIENLIVLLICLVIVFMIMVSFVLIGQ